MYFKTHNIILLLLSCINMTCCPLPGLAATTLAKEHRALLNLGACLTSVARAVWFSGCLIDVQYGLTHVPTNIQNSVNTTQPAVASQTLFWVCCPTNTFFRPTPQVDIISSHFVKQLTGNNNVKIPTSKPPENDCTALPNHTKSTSNYQQRPSTSQSSCHQPFQSPNYKQ